MRLAKGADVSYKDEISRLRDRSTLRIPGEAWKLASKYRKSVHQVLTDIGIDGSGKPRSAEFIQALSALVTWPTRPGSHYSDEYDQQFKKDLVVPTNGQAFFAFVEDRNSFRFHSTKELPEEASGWGGVLDARSESQLEPPTQVVWLDAIEAGYFLDLPWRNERCEIGDIQAGLRRRELLGTLDIEKRRVIVAPLSKESRFEGSCIENFLPCSWHLVVLARQGGTPVASIPDFDIDNYSDLPAQYLHYAGRLREDEYASVENVFNLNFLPEIQERVE